MEKILFVEDDPVLREAAQRILADAGFLVTAAADGRQALQALTAGIPDLIVSDIAMPEMDGFALLDAVRSTANGVTIPFLFISAISDPQKISEARIHSADDYLIKPFQVSELVDAARSRLERRRQVLLFDTQEAHLQTVRMLANAIEGRDRCTRGHVERVREYALALGSALVWSRERLIVLECGSLLHDIGKVLVPDDVLNKNGPLTSGERAAIEQHVVIGAQMLNGVSHLQAVIPYILYHHEHWDGSGYPHALAGEAIPLEGRLLAVVDAFDAMTSERPYRARLSVDQALLELRRKRGIQFDPVLADTFLQLMEGRA